MPDDGGRAIPAPVLEALTHALFDLGSAVDLVAQATASRLNINQADLICLHLLQRYGPMSPGQVAATLGLTTAAISAMATRLETGGFAFREMDPKDRRRVLMHLSPSGSQLALDLFDAFSRATSRLAVSRREDDLRNLITLAGEFHEAITDQAAMRTARPLDER